MKDFLTQARGPQGKPDKKLRADLLKLRRKEEERLSDAVAENKDDEAIIKRLRASRAQNTDALCSILKTHGWLGKDAVGEDGVMAVFFLLKNSSSFELQVDLLPLVTERVKQGEISRSSYAAYIDRLRLSSGLKQLFGTQATMLNGFLVMFPIEAESQVDIRRKGYALSPLADYQHSLETRYRLPLIRSTGALTNSYSDSAQSAIANATSAALFDSKLENDDVIRVETDLVSLNVSTYGEKLRTYVATLGESDFKVTEDGHEQQITFFASTDVPFDLVLLLDLSGSTAGKRDLIRKSTRKFIEAARPSDRLAIVTFASDYQIISPLSDDRAALLASIKRIEGGGGSNVWDALKFTLDRVLGPAGRNRRKAVVFMTDGVDNALGPLSRGSATSFSDLLEAVRHSDALIIPIYLDTESSNDYGAFGQRMYENARKTLSLLAEESGGLYYRAGKMQDLEGVYDQVIEDLGRIYSLGYKSSNERRDASWRTVKIEIPTHPELRARTRPGYYAK